MYYEDDKAHKFLKEFRKQLKNVLITIISDPRQTSLDFHHSKILPIIGSLQSIFIMILGIRMENEKLLSQQLLLVKKSIIHDTFLLEFVVLFSTLWFRINNEWLNFLFQLIYYHLNL